MPAQPASHRYGLVLVVSIVVLITMTALPSGGTGTALLLFLEGLLLVVALRTSGEPRGRPMSALVAATAVVATAAALTGQSPQWVSIVLGGVLALATAALIMRGAHSLLRQSGVTWQIVCAGLALYIIVGVVFADAIGVCALLGSGDFFAQGTDGTPGERAYYSFVSLTTTGFGDLSAATAVGHVLAVLEILIGQIYLVTVVSLMVTNLRPRASRSS